MIALVSPLTVDSYRLTVDKKSTVCKNNILEIRQWNDKGVREEC